MRKTKIEGKRRRYTEKLRHRLERLGQQPGIVNNISQLYTNSYLFAFGEWQTVFFLFVYNIFFALVQPPLAVKEKKFSLTFSPNTLEVQYTSHLLPPPSVITFQNKSCSCIASSPRIGLSLPSPFLPSHSLI